MLFFLIQVDHFQANEHLQWSSGKVSWVSNPTNIAQLQLSFHSHHLPIIFQGFPNHFPFSQKLFCLVITCIGDCNKALPLKLLKACVTFGGPAVSPRPWKWGSPGKRRFHEISYWKKQSFLGSMLIFLGWSWWRLFFKHWCNQIIFVRMLNAILRACSWWKVFVLTTGIPKGSPQLLIMRLRHDTEWIPIPDAPYVSIFFTYILSQIATFKGKCR